ncbi:hypothetical protein DESPIG_02349 [Desulfovibrio piger ATCC 29098]|uniref:Uncharacterized protein n=1 Tax=Desulfovibrio piger ATCC 29098 TaxID=411464 RepID=B6WW81_9BACT|nr:hypothetical protein DESPIG_02349 [Desulfovibrio piger ATCC 29098]
MQGGKGNLFGKRFSLPPLHPPILSKNFYLEGWQWREGRRPGRRLPVSIRQDRICMKGRDRIAASGQRSPEKRVRSLPLSSLRSIQIPKKRTSEDVLFFCAGRPGRWISMSGGPGAAGVICRCYSGSGPRYFLL